jgi:hypothetical protein
MTQLVGTAKGAPDRVQVPPEQLRKATLAASVGSALEYYDFALYGTASALIFGKLFSSRHSASTRVSFSVSRPTRSDLSRGHSAVCFSARWGTSSVASGS